MHEFAVAVQRLDEGEVRQVEHRRDLDGADPGDRCGESAAAHDASAAAGA
ncbi:MAG: hypothetical protein ACK595_06115 [Planctomycetota bacterium]